MITTQAEPHVHTGTVWFPPAITHFLFVREDEALLSLLLKEQSEHKLLERDSLSVRMQLPLCWCEL